MVYKSYKHYRSIAQKEIFMSHEKRVAKLALDIPTLSNDSTYYGQQYGKMKPYYRYQNLLFLSGHVPDLTDGTVLHPGKVGKDVSIEDAYEAARFTGLNCLAGIRQAIGTLDN